jgi:preprotein translocase subunit SecE
MCLGHPVEARRDPGEDVCIRFFRRCERSAMAKTNPFDFLTQVRSEAAKVTWPTRKETMITTAMVFVMVVLASIFFLVVDQAVGWGVRSILLGFGG